MIKAVLISIIFLFNLSLAAVELRRGNRIEPESLDPHKILGVYEGQIIYDLFEGLVAYGPNGEVLPALAEKWEISEDGTVYTFHLKDAQWSNGEDITAYDVVYSFKRLLMPSTASPSAFILYPIKNAQEMNGGHSKDSNPLGVKALDRNTVEITLSNPMSYFLDVLAHRAAVVLYKKSLLSSPNTWTSPDKIVTNGAYILKEWKSLNSIKIVKNPYYWDKENVSIDNVFYFPIEDKKQEWQRFKTGDLHITSDVPNEYIEIARKDFAKAYRESPSLLFYFLSLNMENLTFKQYPKIRQALSIVIDREKFVQTVTKNSEKPAYTVVPKGIKGYKSEKVDFQDLPFEERVKEAQKLYEESGFSKDNPLKLEVIYNSDTVHKRNLVAIAAMWKEHLGIETDLKEMEWKVYLQKRNAGDFMIARCSWIGDYPHPSTFLEIFRSTSSGQNPSKYKNPEFDNLLDKALRSETEPVIFEIFKEAEKILLDDFPIIPLYHGNNRNLVDPKLKGFEDNILGIHRSKYLKFE